MRYLLTLLPFLLLSVGSHPASAKRPHRPDPILIKRALHEAGLSDQQIRRIELIRSEVAPKLLDLRHKMDHLRLAFRQEMQADAPQQEKLFGLIDQIGEVRIEMKKQRVVQLLNIRKEVTPEQWEKLEFLRAQQKMRRHHRFHQGQQRNQKQ